MPYFIVLQHGYTCHELMKILSQFQLMVLEGNITISHLIFFMPLDNILHSNPIKLSLKSIQSRLNLDHISSHLPSPSPTQAYGEEELHPQSDQSGEREKGAERS